jgi:peroxin-12
VRLPSDRTVCPLCQGERRNPTCIPSGYVFCYACIFDHVAAHGACPVTRLPCTKEQLRKLYDN